MKITDVLYGQFELPDYLEPLLHTELLTRLRNITQAILPNCLNQHGPIPSRFRHSLGVAHLAQLVIANNPLLKPYERLLTVAALLHDAGNPCFSHLSEPFLNDLCGYDGETFLQPMLKNIEMETLLRQLKLPAAAIIRLVTGKSPPLSKILHGSLDIDNSDKVGRYEQAAFGYRTFSPERIADSFRFDGRCWTLPQNSLTECRKWQAARAKVYDLIYAAGHLSPATMLHRALQLAWGQIRLNRGLEFFKLDDRQAINFLLQCNASTATLVRLALRWQWHAEAIKMDFHRSILPRVLQTGLDSTNWKLRRMLADQIAHGLRASQSQVCVYFGQGRDYRTIAVPFVGNDGKARRMDEPAEEIYRLRVYIAPELSAKQKQIEKQLKNIFSGC